MYLLYFSNESNEEDKKITTLKYDFESKPHEEVH